MNPMRMVVGDDSDLLILGVRALIERDYRFQIVGLARSNDALIRTSRHVQPDVILWGCQTLDVLTTIEQLRRVAPSAKQIMIGTIIDGVLIRDLLMMGLDGYLHQGDDLTLCLTYLSSTARSAYEGEIGRDQREKPDPLDGELRDVLQRLAEGASIREIAHELAIPEKRVYRLRNRLRRRFDAKTNEHLIQRALIEGFIHRLAL
jgi:two-component system capsular synthesis response regulator RcsB